MSLNFVVTNKKSKLIKQYQELEVQRVQCAFCTQGTARCRKILVPCIEPLYGRPLYVTRESMTYVANVRNKFGIQTPRRSYMKIVFAIVWAKYAIFSIHTSCREQQNNSFVDLWNSTRPTLLTAFRYIPKISWPLSNEHLHPHTSNSAHRKQSSTHLNFLFGPVQPLARFSRKFSFIVSFRIRNELDKC